MGLRGLDPVKFDFDGAKELASELRRTADTLSEQVGSRKDAARAAREEWRGRFARQFDSNMRILTNDSRSFVEALRTAATALDELADLAREENRRREKARAWQREQESEGRTERAWEWLTGTDEERYVYTPAEPKHVKIQAPSAGGRAH